MSNEIFKKVSAAFVSQQGGFTSHGVRMEMSLSLQSVKLTDIFFTKIARIADENRQIDDGLLTETASTARGPISSSAIDCCINHAFTPDLAPQRNAPQDNAQRRELSCVL